MSSSAKSRLRGDMITFSQYIHRVATGEGDELFKLKNIIGMRSNYYKLVEDKLRLNTRRFLMV